MSSSKKKIYILVPSATGHINPILGLVHELCKQPNIECIFYGNEEHRDIISGTGAKFRLFVNRNYANMPIESKTKDGKTQSALVLLNTMTDSTYEILPQVLSDYEREKPDMIIYELLFIPIKYLVTILKDYRRENLTVVEFFSGFIMDKEIIQKVPEINIFSRDLSTLLQMGILFFKLYMINWKFGLWILNPIAHLMAPNDNIKLIPVLPELQPMVEKFDKKYFKFIGQCVSEQARNHEMNDDSELKSLLDLFPIKDGENDSNLKLIFMSLGTVYNHNTSAFEAMIDAIREFDKNPGRTVKAAQLRLILSVGVKGNQVLSEKISTGELTLPEGVLIRPKVPQLEVLKRAHVFVTHCGMNSTSEAIKYGVPIIGIPIEADQPLVAKQVCDWLSAGVRLNLFELNPDLIGDTIDKILSDDIYSSKMKELSMKSAKYNGLVDGLNIILELLSKR